MEDGLCGAIDFKYLLIESYKKFELTETEVTTILVIDHLINQGNNLVTADLLALKMPLSMSEIDKVLVSLLSKNVLEYDNQNNEMRTTLSPLKKRLLKEYEADIIHRTQDEGEQEFKKELKEITDAFEKSLERKLSPLENERIKEWINYGYSTQFVLDCLRDALNEGKRTIRAVDKIIIKKATRNDVSKEGYSAINENWKADIGTTIDMATKKWNDND